MTLLENMALMLLLALLPFQDLVLQKAIRSLGASLSVFPLAALLLLHLLRRISALNFRISQTAFRYLSYAAVLTAAYLFIFGSEIHGTSLVWKSLNLFVMLGLFVFSAVGPTYERNRWAWAGCMIGFTFTLLAAVAGPGLDGNGLLHATVNLDARPRGFCTESSTFSVQVVVSGLLAALVAKHAFSKSLLLVATGVLLLLSGSKGGLISLLLCCAFYWVARAGLSPLKLLAGAALLVPLGFLVSGLIAQGFENDMISNGSSVATRATMCAFAFYAVLHNPLGVGFSGFYPALALYLPDAMQASRSVFDFPLVFTEVSTYRYAIENADCKAFFLDLLVFFGIPFAVVYFTFFFKLCRKLYRDGQQILLIGAMFCCVALLSYYSSMNCYSIPVFIGFCLSSRHHEKHSLRQRA